jgi:hypothetical protein
MDQQFKENLLTVNEQRANFQSRSEQVSKLLSHLNEVVERQNDSGSFPIGEMLFIRSRDSDCGAHSEKNTVFNPNDYSGILSDRRAK